MGMGYEGFDCIIFQTLSFQTTVLKSQSTSTHSNSPTLMSSSITSASFRSILDTALDSYAKQTGIDLATHPSALEIWKCDTSEDILRLLQDRETAFEEFRGKNRKLIDRLRPVIQIVHAFSGVLGEVGGLVGFSPHHPVFNALTRYHSNQQK